MTILVEHFHSYREGQAAIAGDEKPEPSYHEAKRFFKDLLEAQYARRFFKSFSFTLGTPVPQPPNLPQNIDTTLQFQQDMIGELFLSAMGDPDPQPSVPSLPKMLKETGLQKEVVQGLIEQFEYAAANLRKDLEFL